ncbi:hypothetical protein CMO86_06835 [Candidatus Woesearchaeota archaeon]|nr:hypothetical protein [Candidatus Woesearchaeota archaeon]
MPKIRIGFSTDFNLVNEQVGIGTTNPESRLNVPGQILADNTAGSGGVSTYREYQGFHQTQSNVSHKVTIDATTAGNLNSLSGELRIDGDVTIAPDTSVTSGKIDSLTATDKFAVPLGETNNRENTPEAGTTRFNQDFGTLEFFDGANWKTVNSYARGDASGRGVFGGGRVPGNSAIIDYIQIMSTGNAINFGDLLVARTDAASFSNEIRGIWAGGKDPTVSTHIDYVTLASRGNGVDFGDVTPAAMGGSGAGASSSTRGVFALGQAPAASDALHYVQIMTTGDSLDFGDLTGNLSEGAACGSPTRGLFNKGSGSTGIDVVLIASKGNAIEFGEDSMGRTDQQRGCGSCSNSIRGFFASGGADSVQTDSNVIRYVTIATNGNAIDFGDRTITTRLVTAAATSTRATFAAGIETGGTNFNNIDYVTISTSGNAIDFGDLTDAFHAHGGCSDSHGGLGGF